MTVEELIKNGATINYYRDKPYNIIEIYRDKFVLIKNEDNEEVVEIDTVLDCWNEEEKKRIEIEEAKNGTSAIEKYFELYGPLSKREHFDQNEEKYPSEYASKGFSNHLMYKVKATPDSMFNWNSEIYFLYLSVRHTKNTNNYFKKAGVVSEVSIDLTQSHEWCIDCNIVNGKPKLRHSHGWYDKMEKEWTPKYENWNDDVEYGFELFWQYCTEEMLKYFDVEKPILKQRNYLYQEESKFIFDMGTLRLNGCEILQNNKFRNSGLGTSALPKSFKDVTNFYEIKNDFRKQFDELVKNPRNR